MSYSFKRKDRNQKSNLLLISGQTPLSIKCKVSWTKIQSLLLENDKSNVFKPHIKQILAAFFDARKSVKKRISEKTGKNIVMEDDENIFERSKDM